MNSSPPRAVFTLSKSASARMGARPLSGPSSTFPQMGERTVESGRPGMDVGGGTGDPPARPRRCRRQRMTAHSPGPSPNTAGADDRLNPPQPHTVSSVGGFGRLTPAPIGARTGRVSPGGYVNRIDRDPRSELHAAREARHPGGEARRRPDPR